MSDVMPAAARSHGDDLLDRLAAGGAIPARTALVVAHPDDETIAMAGVMARFTRLDLIHVTDGAAGPGEVADRRRAEVTAAIGACSATPRRRIAYGLPDGGVLGALDRLVDRLALDFGDVDVVLTHPFEGGHVDHDACAIAVALACERLSAAGSAPDQMEFASYHKRRGKVRSGVFLPAVSCRVVRIELRAAARQRRTAAFACHRSQEMNLRYFSLESESFRTAPAYDFASGPAEETTLYDEPTRAMVRAIAARNAT